MVELTPTPSRLLVLRQASPLRFCHPPVVCSVHQPFPNLMAFMLTAGVLSAERLMRLTQPIFFPKVFNKAEQRVPRPRQHWNPHRHRLQLVYTITYILKSKYWRIHKLAPQELDWHSSPALPMTHGPGVLCPYSQVKGASARSQRNIPMHSRCCLDE